MIFLFKLKIALVIPAANEWTIETHKGSQE